MFKKSIYSIIALSCILSACQKQIDPTNAPLTPNYDATHELITVYKDSTEIPKGATIITHVKAMNSLPNGTKATPEAIMVELKRQAKLAGGFGLVHITPGTAQTTADVVGVR
ncbi:hypothetical protein [Legionella saoudiensis]|uniref:hypothetical protein n=1 Tax=Legionella saoudiensis TaxID=1750561 RepID=UPI00073162CE|nr:hypothetical protein [Legionella saoudiensis]